jgi:hypothetical protein
MKTRAARKMMYVGVARARPIRIVGITIHASHSAMLKPESHGDSHP